MDIEMEQLLQENILRRRFDPITTHHILDLWSRASDALNLLLEKGDRHIVWDCEDVDVPFTRANEASLMMMLSELRHPTDGNDFLFLFIHSIIQEYNSFALRLNEAMIPLRASDTTQDGSRELHPRFLLRGSPGVIAISAECLTDFSENSGFIESYWSSDGFQSRRLRQALRDGRFVEEVLPTIMNPTSFLRECFHFRDIGAPNLVEDVDSSNLATKTADDLYFVHTQDLQLYEETRQVINSSRSVHVGNYSDHAILHAMRVHFRDSDYLFFRSILEGIRCVFNQTRASYPDMDESVTLNRVICGILVPNSTADEAIREGLGFPVLSDSQWQLLGDVEIAEIPQVVRFIGYQLASEGYKFAHLPLRMTEPLPQEARETMDNLLAKLCETEGVNESLLHLDDFVTSCLSFYESPVHDAASENNPPLKSFLEASSFGDKTTFPFLEAVPDLIMLRHYVAFRQHLNQLRLRLRVTIAAGNKTNINPKSTTETGPNLSKSRRGQSWLWRAGADHELDNQEIHDENEEKERLVASLENIQRLWFDSLSEGKKDNSNEEEMVGKGAVVAEEDETVSTRTDKNESAARQIQRYWKRQGMTKARDHRAVPALTKESQSPPQSTTLAPVPVLPAPEATQASAQQNPTSNRSWWLMKFISCILLASLVSILATWLHRNYNNQSLHAPMRPNDIEEHNELGSWLKKHRLPPNLIHDFAGLGARTIDDLNTIVKNYPEMLESFAPLDQRKIHLAVERERAGMDETREEL